MRDNYTIGGGIGGGPTVNGNGKGEEATPRRMHRDDAVIKDRVRRDLEEGLLPNEARESSMDRYKHHTTGMKSTMRDSPEYEDQRAHGDQTLRNEEQGLANAREYVSGDAGDDPDGGGSTLGRKAPSSEKDSSSILGRAAERVSNALGVGS